MTLEINRTNAARRLAERAFIVGLHCGWDLRGLRPNGHIPRDAQEEMAYEAVQKMLYETGRTE